MDVTSLHTWLQVSQSYDCLEFAASSILVMISRTLLVLNINVWSSIVLQEQIPSAVENITPFTFKHRSHPTPIFKSMFLIIFFLSVLASNSLWLVEFYTPWCGHCTHFAPHYEQVTNHQWPSCYQHWLAQVGLSLEGKANVGKVNCERYKQLCSQVLHSRENQAHLLSYVSKAEVTGYPTVRIYNRADEFLVSKFQQQSQQISKAQWDSTCFFRIMSWCGKGRLMTL